MNTFAKILFYVFVLFTAMFGLMYYLFPITFPHLQNVQTLRDSMTDMFPRCPNLLRQEGTSIVLYDLNQPASSINPAIFTSLDEYALFVQEQEAKGVKCPVLELQTNMEGSSLSNAPMVGPSTDLESIFNKGDYAPFDPFNDVVYDQMAVQNAENMDENMEDYGYENMEEYGDEYGYENMEEYMDDNPDYTDNTQNMDDEISSKYSKQVDYSVDAQKSAKTAQSGKALDSVNDDKTTTPSKGKGLLPFKKKDKMDTMQNAHDEISDNPIDTNWGGVQYSAQTLASGKYDGDMVTRPLYYNMKQGGVMIVPGEDGFEPPNYVPRDLIGNEIQLQRSKS